MDPIKTRGSLLARVKDPADAAAWREFEACYGELIVRYARARGLQRADAEDVRQVVLLGLSKSLRNFQYSPERGRFRDYLGRVVKNAVQRVITRPGPPERALDTGRLDALAAHDDASADAGWEQEWLNHHYRRALAVVRSTFEPRSVAVFERLLAGEPVEAAGASFGLSPAAVRKLSQRIRRKMTDLVQAQIRAEDAAG